MQCACKYYNLFILMVSKSCRKYRQNKSKYFIAMLTPVLFSTLITILGNVNTTSPRENPESDYRDIEFDVWWTRMITKIAERRERMLRERPKFKSSVFIPKIMLGYAPNTTIGLRKLIRGIMRAISFTPVQVRGYADCNELRTRAYAEHYIASLCFNSIDESQRGLPLKFNFSIILPSELRFYEATWIGNNWKYQMYDTNPTGQAEIENSTFSSYVREGFLSLQYYVCSEYLKIASGNAEIPKILMREFEQDSDVNELVGEGVDTTTLVLLIGFMFPVTIFTKEIVEERELCMYLIMSKSLARLQFIVWYIGGVFHLMIACVIFTVLLKIDTFGFHSAFNHCPWYILFSFFSSYILSCVAFCMLMSVLIKTTKMVVATLPVYWLLLTLPLLSGQSLQTTWTLMMYQTSSIILCNVTLCRGLQRILCFEHHVGDLSPRNYMMSTLTGTDPSLLTYIGYFYLQTLSYLILALVLDGNLCPCILKAIKCQGFRYVFTRMQWTLRRRRRRLQRLEEQLAELDETRSRRLSETTDINETLTQTIDLYEDEPPGKGKHSNHSYTHRQFANENRPKINRSIESKRQSVSDSHSSDSIATSTATSIVPDKQLMVWFSNEDLQIKKSHDDESTQFFLEPSNQIEQSSGAGSFSTDSAVDESRPVVIEFKNVWKKYLHYFVVRNFSLKVYQNEMMVVLGHNGSGKTTLINMLCGKERPTTGEIFINGFNVKKHAAKAYQHVGISLQNLYGFRDFTVFEQIVYFCRLRGLSIEKANQDALSYLTSMEMQEYKDKPVKHLTNGQHRLMMVMCAFAGRTTVVLLDKPLEGVDVRRRRLFYRFALKEKSVRTIFITTNVAQVASNLGDRITILVSGRIYVCATERVLLKSMINAYQVVCYLGGDCKFDELFNHFARHIPSIELELRMGDSAIFVVDYIDLKRLVALMKGLSSMRKDLGLDSYQVKAPSIDNVLLRAMEESTGHSKRITNPEELFELVEEARRIKKKSLTNCGKLKARITSIGTYVGVVLRKRYLMDLRECAMPIMQIFLPSALCAWTLVMPHLTEERRVLKTNQFLLSQFTNMLTLVQRRVTLEPLMIASSHYMSQINQFADHMVIEVNENDDFLDYMKQYMFDHLQITDLSFIVAVNFTDEHVDAIYNANIRNSPPISLNLVMDSIAAGYVNPHAGITVQLELLPYSTLHTAYITMGVDCLDWLLVIMTSLCFCYAWALPLLNFGLGRNTPYSRIEMIAGMPFGFLSLANFLYAIFKVILSMIPLNAILLLFSNDVPWTLFDNYLFMYIVFVMGIYVISIDIVISYWVSDIRLGYIIITTFFSLGIIGYLLLYEMQGNAFKNYSDSAVLSVHPFFSMVRNLMDRNNNAETARVCEDYQTYETSVYLEHCEMLPNCCAFRKENYLYWGHMFPTFILILVIWAFLYCRPFLLLTKVKPQNRRDIYRTGSDPDSLFDQTVLHFGSRTESDKAWIKEKIQVRSLERPVIKRKALKVENLSVAFGPRVVLNHINFLVERYQIVSLVGQVSSGKTVLMKTLLGWLSHTTGTIISFGRHTKEFWMEEDFTNIGYCAQDNALIDPLTVQEVIEFVLHIRRIKNITESARSVMRIFDLYDNRSNLLPFCSRGILKRLNIALSMISYSGLILMDDPFAYLDAPGLRSIYKLIEAQCRNGAAVLYTSTDPRFCDLSNRTAILKPPSLCAIGDREELNSKIFSAYFVVETCLRTDLWRRVNTNYRPFKVYFSEDAKHFEMICSIVESLFPDAIVIRSTNHQVLFWLSCKTYPMTYILEVLHRHEHLFFSYLITTPGIRSIFDSIIKAPARKEEIIEDHDL